MYMYTLVKKNNKQMKENRPGYHQNNQEDQVWFSDWKFCFYSFFLLRINENNPGQGFIYKKCAKERKVKPHIVSRSTQVYK